MKNWIAIVAVGWFVGLGCGAEPRLAWPRFRGPNGSGVADDQVPPVRFGPESNVKWKVTVPSGLSSPIVAGDKLVLTALDQGKLYTIAYQRSDGKEAWRKEAPAKKIEPFLKGEGSPAASTPVTDGRESSPISAPVACSVTIWTEKNCGSTRCRWPSPGRISAAASPPSRPTAWSFS